VIFGDVLKKIPLFEMLHEMDRAFLPEVIA
jgi:hypothetical protein